MKLKSKNNGIAKNQVVEKNEKKPVPSNISASLITRDMREITQKTGNVYESVYIIAQRAKQIAAKTKEELTAKLNDFSSPIDNLEEIFENREQIEISKFYEKMPKPTTLATEEFLEDKLAWKNPDELEN